MPDAETTAKVHPLCGVCGVPHPFLTVCPFVEEEEVRVVYGRGADGQRKVAERVIRRRYFQRPQVFDAIAKAATESEESE